MKKSLIIMPLTVLLLSGCQSGGRSSGGGGGGCDGDNLPPIQCYDFGSDTVDGYRRVKGKPVDGKEYLFGFFHVAANEFRFIDGNYHIDPVTKKHCPYYLSTTTDVNAAVKVKCHYPNDSDHFSIQIFSGGDNPVYADKYLEMHEDNNSKKDLASISAVNYEFDEYVYYDIFSHYQIESCVVEYGTTRLAHEQAIFACSGAEFFTVSAVEKVDIDKGYVCHFYEKI